MAADSLAFVAAIICVATLGAYYVIVTIRALAARRSAIAFRQEQEEKNPYAALRGVTLLQPILSGDPELEPTLRANVEASPDSVRFIWLVDETDAEGRRIAENLRSEFAAAGGTDRLRIELCPDTSLTENPKAAKLERGLALVLTDHVGALDDDTIVPSKSLASAMAELDAFDLATGLPVYRDGRTFWGNLVADFVNDNSCTTYLPLSRSLGPLSINGMFYVTRTETLRSLGGFASVRDRLCDDYAIAKLYLDAGKTLRQTIDPQFVGTTVTTAGAYFRLLHRWNRFGLQLVRDQPVRIQALLCGMLGLPPLLLWACVASACVAAALNPGAWFWLPPAVVAGAAVSLTMFKVAVHRQIVPELSAGNIARSLLVELLQPIHLLHALAVPTIVWRGRRIRTAGDGKFREIEGFSG